MTLDFWIQNLTSLLGENKWCLMGTHGSSQYIFRVVKLDFNRFYRYLSMNPFDVWFKFFVYLMKNRAKKNEFDLQCHDLGQLFFYLIIYGHIRIPWNYICFVAKDFFYWTCVNKSYKIKIIFVKTGGIWILLDFEFINLLKLSLYFCFSESIHFNRQIWVASFWAFQICNK